MKPVDIAKRLGRSYSSINSLASQLGVRYGIPPGYVSIRSVVNGNVNACRHIARVARAEGVLHQADLPRAPKCVPEEWMDKYLSMRLSRAEAEIKASREGWYSGKDIMVALGKRPEVASQFMSHKRGSIAKAFKGVPVIIGNRGKRYYEPEATRAALIKLGASIHRRAA